MRLRIQHACRLMSDTSTSLTDVAAACGFADQSHLTRVFEVLHRIGGAYLANEGFWTHKADRLRMKLLPVAVSRHFVYDWADLRQCLTAHVHHAEADYQAAVAEHRAVYRRPRGRGPGGSASHVYTSRRSRRRAQHQLRSELGGWQDDLLAPRPALVPLAARRIRKSSTSVPARAIFAEDFDTGVGIFKSTDAGQTWKYAGSATRIRSALVVDPHNPNVVYATTMGHVFTPNAERGIYKTTDGGKTWRKVLYVDAKTGGNDVVMDPDTLATPRCGRRTAYLGSW